MNVLYLRKGGVLQIFSCDTDIVFPAVLQPLVRNGTEHEPAQIRCDRLDGQSVFDKHRFIGNKRIFFFRLFKIEYDGIDML